MNKVIDTMLSKYELDDLNKKNNAMKEIIQELVLCGLSRGGFFDVAAFYGGTALRIFYGLDRFSEDLDFALVEANKSFDLSYYFSFIENEVKAYGLNMTIVTKQKNVESNIVSAFLKGDTKEHILTFFPSEDLKNEDKMLKAIKIKFEIDVLPPVGANYEFKYKLLPSPHQVRLYDEGSLFAGKIHAILCRNWKKRTKGRDLYDYVFFLSKNIKVNMKLVISKLVDSKFIGINDSFEIEDLRNVLKKKFDEINYEDAKRDVVSFLNMNESLEIWNANFFKEITNDLKQG